MQYLVRSFIGVSFQQGSEENSHDNLDGGAGKANKDFGSLWLQLQREEITGLLQLGLSPSSSETTVR